MAYRRKQGPLAADDRGISHLQGSASSYEYTSIKSLNEPKLGLWGALTRKAKEVPDTDAVAHKFEDYTNAQPHNLNSSNGTQVPQSLWSFENYVKTGNSASRTRSEALSASVNQLSGRIKNALEEGLTIVDNKATNIIQETKKIQIRRKSSSPSSNMQNQATDTFSPNFSQSQAEAAAQETQLKASRDVANAMAAKAKLLLRELKTVKADLAFAKERCAQLEEENKILRETKQKGSRSEDDDDLIRLQLESLLAEKSRLAQENSMYTRENRFLREIVEFHQFTTHNVVSLDADMEDNIDEEEEEEEEDMNLTNTHNVLSFVEADAAHGELSLVLSSPPGEPSSPKSSNALSSQNLSVPNTV